MRIGVIGLGSMGAPMARNLVAAGHEVRGFDIAPEKLAAATACGIAAAESAAGLAARCELLILMVWDDDALRDALFGPAGICSSRQLPQCVVDFSTTSVALAHEAAGVLRQRDCVFLDGAVIGGGAAAAQAATSPIVVAGDRATYDRYLPTFARLGRCDYVGAQGHAKVVKLINNLLVGVVTAANAEALSLGLALGVELPQLVDRMRASAGASRVLDSYMGRYVAEGRYPEGLIGHRLMAKDLRLAAELAESMDCAVTYPRFGEQMYATFGRVLGDDRPFPSAFEYFRRMSSVEATAPRVPLEFSDQGRSGR